MVVQRQARARLWRDQCPDHASARRVSTRSLSTVTMASLSTIRPSFTRILCKRQLCAYLSPTQRFAHTLPPVQVKTPKQRSRRKGGERPRTGEPSDDTPKSPYYGKLKPYDLSQRLRALIEKDDYKGAVDLLKNMPLDAQTVSVWNTVIKAAFEEEKYKLAYSLYADVRSLSILLCKDTHNHS